MKKLLSLICIAAFILELPLLAQNNLSNNLILHYEFNDPIGSTKVTDSSPMANHGAIKGSGAVISKGELRLPGGNAGSSAGYIQLPTGMFDDQNTLTISVWLKNETGWGNYAAMFFGTAESQPLQYWLLNPANPDGRLKSVITNDKLEKPWTSEYGFSPSTASQGMNGVITSSEWALYTTIIQPNAIIAYYNGTKIGEVAVSRTVSDFGSNLVAYIGRSSYNDKFYKGAVKRVKVFNTALTDFDIKNEYYSGQGNEALLKALEEDKNALTLPAKTDMINDLVLPAMGSNGSHIKWASSDIAFIDEDGQVIRDKKLDRGVVMTVTLTLAEKSVSKSFLVNVLADTPERQLEYITNQFDLGISYVTENIVLPSATGEDYTISWVSNNNSLLDNNGNVNRPAVGKGNQQVTLTATISKGGLSSSKDFVVTVAEASYGYLMSYIMSGGTERTNSFFIANSLDGSAYTSLNNSKAIVYPLVGTKKLRQPWLFRKPDGSFGLIATDNNSNGVIIYHSPDLIDYVDETYLALNNEKINIMTFMCDYDNAKRAYSIRWQGRNGKYYETTTKDFKTIESTVEIAAFSRPATSGKYPSKAIDRSVIALTKDEYERVVRKYGKITNTGITSINPITIKNGGQLNLPDRVTAEYNDGSTKQLGVEWSEEDINNVDLGSPGEYTINGIVQQPDYANPLIRQRADPWITKGDDGYYYFTASYPMVGSGDPEGYDRVILRRATSIEGLATAEEITIWDEKNCPSCFRYVWAPEIHQIDGTWFVFFTTSLNNAAFNIRPRVITCSLGEKDPSNPACWETVGHLMEPSNDDKTSFRDFSLDMTYFENKGTHYVIWAQKLGNSSLAIASVDGTQPWKATSAYTLLTSPEYAWEWEGPWVNEGAAVIKHNGKIYVAFSASAVNHTYCVGLMYADEDSDLLDIRSWTKVRYPLLSTEDLPEDQSGPGHNSFTTDQYGNPVIVYHARNPKETTDGGLYDPRRHAFVKSVNFAFDGTPIFNMKREDELNPANKNVLIKVIVE
ncbi:family 43 glycosylhydrolase [Dysgonomonas sp. 520]|uniref:family 43 glycosylhydrolase n=1 Tax=Dysgonomonas sp. 520 TaxID=2302931 RepID=UPI0013D05F9A|nr:family 43 glycosylhydrolase [Dysgonomonas sp. 520]NDW08356.1 hypothetical protein [Dysgonomonas sp. 520]